MDFGEMLRELVKGRLMRSTAWAAYDQSLAYRFIEYREGDGYDPHIMAMLATGRMVPFQPSNYQLFTSVWEYVDQDQ